jgi:hypothetical protein
MYIEDYLIQFYLGTVRVGSFDGQIASSLGLQAYEKKPMTAKQGAVSLKLIKKYSKQFVLKGFDSVYDDIENPNFKNPFRIVENRKTINITNGKISIKFPFDQNLVNTLREISNQSVFCKPIYHPEDKSWIMELNEESLLVVMEKFSDFEWSEDIANFVNQIHDIRKNMDRYIPILTKVKDNYCIKNSIFDNSYTNLEHALIDSFKKGIYVYDDIVNSELIELTTSNALFKLFSSSPAQKFLINNEDFSKKEILSFLNKFDTTVAIFVNEKFDSEDLITWTEDMTSEGILIDQISVYFRKPSEHDKEFNQKVKDLKLNKDASNTEVKWMFLSSKYPKSLIKNNKVADICLFVDKHISTHYTIINVANCSLLNIYYSDKRFVISEDTKNNKRGEKIVVL